MNIINGDPGDECPICLDPLPADTMRGGKVNRSWHHATCCGKKICKGCRAKMRKYNVDETVRRMGHEKVIAKLQQGVDVELDDTYCPLCRCPLAKSIEDDFKLVLKRAKNGKAWAQYIVGLMYTTGEGVKKNVAEGARWLKKAAEAGNEHAIACYAECCYFGSGVPTSLIDAKYWYEKASDAGNMVAQHFLGVLLSYGGPGVPADPVEAVRLFRISADQGYDRAQCDLAKCFDTGQGVETNIEQAMHWYGKAISQGDVNAMFNYALVLSRNAGGNHSTGESPIPQALYWLRKAAAGGVEESTKVVAKIEQHVSSRCVHCGIGKDSCKKLLKCKNCKAAYYCGRSCQVKNWQMGHNIDCGWRKNSSVHALINSDNEPRDATTVSKAKEED